MILDVESLDLTMDRDTVLRVGISSARDRNKQYMDLIFDLLIARLAIPMLRKYTENCKIFWEQNFKHITIIQICKNDPKI